MTKEEKTKAFITDFDDLFCDMEMHYFLMVLQKEEENETRLISKKTQCTNSFFDIIILLEEITSVNVFGLLFLIGEIGYLIRGWIKF
jgi:hypothetical protein